MLQMFSVYDEKSFSYTKPFYARSIPEAIRIFESGCADSECPFSRYPDDYVLYHCGEFDEFKCVVSGVLPPKRLCKASEVISQKVLNFGGESIGGNSETV